MTLDQAIVFATLGMALVLFAWGYWRHDLVAMLALLTLVLIGIIPADAAYKGFGHPAVITVAAMLVISASLEETGVVEAIARHINTAAGNETATLLILVGVVTALSAFMNNVGALALMMPVTLSLASRKDIHPSRLLMPVAFGSILGGLATLIGTPPNIIVAAYREEELGQSFSLFDFAPVGLAVALAGLAAISVFSRMLLSKLDTTSEPQSLEYVESYLTEIVVPDDSSFVGQTIGDLEDLGRGNINVLGLIRGEQTIVAPRAATGLVAEDILVLEAEPTALEDLINASGVVLAAERKQETDSLKDKMGQFVEAVVMPRSLLEGQTLSRLRLHGRYGLNLLAIARRGETIRARLGNVRFQIGDLILVQGNPDEVDETLADLGCMPVSGKSVDTRKFSLFPLIAFAGGLLASVLGLVPIHISLVAAAALIVAARYLPLRRVYESIDWAVIILLAAMVPVGESLESTGATALIASAIMSHFGDLSGAAIVATLILVAMALSNIVNNAATAILMAPLSIEIARGLGFAPDPLLMAVAVGSSCAFILPIGHQSNLLVMGPGGYHFGDYGQLGTVVSLAVAAAAVPAILFFWPLTPV